MTIRDFLECAADPNDGVCLCLTTNKSNCIRGLIGDILDDPKNNQYLAQPLTEWGLGLDCIRIYL